MKPEWVVHAVPDNQPSSQPESVVHSVHDDQSSSPSGTRMCQTYDHRASGMRQSVRFSATARLSGDSNEDLALQQSAIDSSDGRLSVLQPSAKFIAPERFGECLGTRVHSCQRGTYAARKFASHVHLLHYTPTRLSEQRRIIAMNLDKRRTRLYRRSVFGLG